MIKLIRIVILLTFFNTNLFSNTDQELYKKIDLFGEVLEKIRKEYVEDIDQSEMIDSAINGALQSLDPYSSYMNPEIFNSVETDTKGEFGGLGIEVGMEAGVIKVISPIDDTPASRAGIKSGDYIVKIDNKQVQGKSLMESVKMMRGPVGSTIKLTIRRKGEKKALEKILKREIIQIKSVEAKILKKNIAYLRLKSFNSNSSKQLIDKINNFEKKNVPTGYILDLRNNPGGLLTQAINVTDFFLEDGEILSTKGRRTMENRRFFARKGDKVKGKPLIVLINAGSASASALPSSPSASSRATTAGRTCC